MILTKEFFPGMSLLKYYAGQSCLTIVMVEEFLKEREEVQLLKMKNESSENYYRYLSGNLAVMKFIEAEAMVKEGRKKEKEE